MSQGVPGRPWMLAHDTEAHRWLIIATCGFLLRYPQALDAAEWRRPKGLEKAADSFRRLGYELYVLEYDLTDCINELLTAYQTLYSDPEALHKKKFAVVYHVDNFYVRVHKFIEDVYRLMARIVGLDHTQKVGPSQLSRQGQVVTALHHRKFYNIANALRAFVGETSIVEAVNARNLFVHQYRDEPEWSMLGPENRLLEFETSDDQDGECIRRLTEADDVDRYADQKANQLIAVLTPIGTLRWRLYDGARDELERLLLRSPDATKSRWNWFVEMCQAERELAKMVEAGQA